MHTLNDMNHEEMTLGHHYEDSHRDPYSLDSSSHVAYLDPELYPSHGGHHLSEQKYQPPVFLPASGKSPSYLSRGQSAFSLTTT